MFQSLGRWVTRTWPLWLLVWGGVLLGCRWAAPSWSEVSEGGIFRFLPADSPSLQAEWLRRLAFDDGLSDSSIVIVANRDDGPLRAEDERFIAERLEPGILRIARDLGGTPDDDPLRPDGDGDAVDQAATDDPETGGAADATPSTVGTRQGPAWVGDDAPPEVVRIRSLARGVERPVVVSQDNQATIVLVELSTSFMERSNRAIVAPVLDLVDRLRDEGAVPDGLELAVTGSAVVGDTINAQEEQTAETIERWTIWWVLLLLVIVHRAPLLALVQMLTVFVAMQVALDLMALMAGAGWIELFEGLNVYTTVLVYGAGIDYSLFLISRYRERLEAGSPPREAMQEAVGRVGLAVTISAATAIVAVGTLLSANFEMFARAGFTIPFGLFVMLLTSLTLAPALLILLGGAAVWPSRPGATAGDRPANGGRLGWLSRVDPLAGLWRRLGGGLRRRPGLIWSLTLLAVLPFAVYGASKHDAVNYAPMAEIPPEAQSARAIASLQEHFPAGIAAPLTAIIQTPPTIDFSTESGTALVGQLADRLMARKDELGLASVRSVAEGFGQSLTPEEEEAERREAEQEGGVIGEALGDLLSGAADLLPGDPREQALRALRERAVSEYVGQAAEPGDTTRLILVPSYDPFGDEALDRVAAIRDAIELSLPDELAGARVAVAGASASLRDLRDVTRADRWRIYALATAGVALVLVVLLRRLAVSLYLLASVLLSYLVTLGVTFLVFGLIDGDAFQGIDWTVPVFLFTLLMAIGADYNVFLLTRVDEEQAEHGPVEGVIEGLRRTGGVISGCGLIMAGTFASLIWGGELRSLEQLGFALAFGVLLDTFVIRPLLVPSLLVLIQGRRPGGRAGTSGRAQEAGGASE